MKKEKIITFEQAVTYLNQLPRFTSKNSPEDTKYFLKQLGNPDKKMRIIHVAGTNGKGSVCAYLNAILREAGKKVAVFTSPHLVDIRERIVVNGKMIEKEEFLNLFLKIYESLDWEALEQEKGYHPTFFEYLFFLAMLHFQKEEPDYCILETGLGGRLDATNSVGKKELTILTKIGLDHVKYLGDTIEQIALEKAGIMQKGVPTVFIDTEPSVSKIFKQQAQKLELPIYSVSKNDYAILGFIKNKSIDFSLHCRYYGYVTFTLQTIAVYQVENAALAVRALEILDKEHMISAEQIQKGLYQAFWSGRMEEVLPEVYVDGAHNEDGIRAFIETVKNDQAVGKRKLLFSVAADKDYPKMLEELVKEGLFAEIAFAPMKTSRTISLEDIDKVMKKYQECAYTLYKSVGAALHKLLEDRKEKKRLYIAGSLYLVGEVKEWIKENK